METRTHKGTLSRIVFLDGLRGAAAVYVLLHHARALQWEGFRDGFALHPEQYTLLGKVLAYAFLSLNYGHQAVIFFFVLSGFVIHLRYAQSLHQDGESARFDLRAYLVRRFRRIYPLFLMSLLATYLIDQIGIAQGYSVYFQNTPYEVINKFAHPQFNITNAIGHLLLIPDTPVWGTNGPLWSLRYEWWFYLIYPLFWWITRRSMTTATALVMGMFALSLVLRALLPINSLTLVFGAFPAWWMGALLAEIYVGRWSISFARVAWLAALFPLLPLTVAPFTNMIEPVQDFLWALGFTGLIAVCLVWQQRKGALAIMDQLGFWGDISYSLYVLHFPILVLISGWLMAQSPTATLPQSFEWVGIGSLVCVLTAYLSHRFVERPFQNSKKAR